MNRPNRKLSLKHYRRMCVERIITDVRVRRHATYTPRAAYRIQKAIHYSGSET